MRSPSLAFLLLAGLGLLLQGSARADHVVLHDGRVIEGKVTLDPLRKTVEVERGGATFTFAQSEVLRVVRDSPEAPPASPGPRAPLDAVVIPLQGPLLYLRAQEEFDRVLQEALELRPRYLILHLSSSGGRVDVARHFVRAILALDGIRTVAFVEGSSQGALSAAAYVALACQRIYTAPGQSIGAAVPFRVDAEGVPTDVSAKFRSAWEAEFRALAERNHYPKAVAAAMVSARDGLAEIQVQGRRAFVAARTLSSQDSQDAYYGVRILCPPGKVLTLTSQEACRVGLARATLQSIQELFARLKIDPKRSTITKDPLVRARKVVRKALAKSKELQAELTHHRQALVLRNPSQGVYALDPRTGTFRDDGQEWRRRTRACLKLVKRCFKLIEELQRGSLPPEDLQLNLKELASLKLALQKYEQQLTDYRGIKAPPRAAPPRRERE